jgi:hypothetical protein
MQMFAQRVPDTTGPSMKLTIHIHASRRVPFFGKAAALPLPSLNR